MSQLPSWCPPYSSLKYDPNTNVELFCICKKPDEGELMVGCDGCDDWFHFKCMKIPQKYKNLVSGFYCPYCQAGITGKPLTEYESGELPKTLWKRKCRLENCYDPIMPESKYCSETHGKEYIQNLLSKSSVGPGSSQEILQDMVSYSQDNIQKFKAVGNEEFVDEDIPEDIIKDDLFKQIISDDGNLQELQNNLQDCKLKTFPVLKKNLEHLQKYSTWLEEVNKKIEGSAVIEDESQIVSEPIAKNKKRKKKNGKNNNRHKVKKICGFTSDLNNTQMTVNEFVERFAEESGKESENVCTSIEGICIKLRCNRHSDWSSMKMEELKQQMRSLENYKERLLLLISTRKRQLHIQYYERLSENSAA